MVPIHVTGFFYPVLREDPKHTGSLGAGFSLSEYVSTRVQKRRDGKVKVYFNGEDVTSEAETSRQAAKEFFKISGKRRGVDIFHQFRVPVSCGLATSGAGALGVEFALNNVFNTSFSRDRLAKLAHIAEVKQKTGLGSVIAQYKGKFEIRVKSGAPKIGKVKRFPMEADVALLIYGQVETKGILNSQEKLREIRQTFDKKHKKLAKRFSLDRFISLSCQFAKESGLMPPFLQGILQKAKKVGLKGSMLMLGEGVFLFGQLLEEKLPLLLERLSKGPKMSLITHITNEGLRGVP